MTFEDLEREWRQRRRGRRKERAIAWGCGLIVSAAAVWALWRYFPREWLPAWLGGESGG